MNFNSPREVDQVCYEMRLSDYPRGLNRARINELFNGFPPYSEAEARENGIEINVNFLESTGLAHDARAQFYQNFLKPGKYFGLRTDGGAKHKRSTYNTFVTKKIAQIMKRSVDYLETYRSMFAQDVLHGVGPSGWESSTKWCPDGIGIEDVGIPAKTYLTMKNLPFFYLYKSFTAPELIKLTRHKHVDKGWNKDFVEKCIAWIDTEMMSLMGSNWPEVWAPEKASERVKGDGGFYCGDQVPTIDCFDFYFYADDGKTSGWRRRIILDSWSAPGSAGRQFGGSGSKNFTRRDAELFNYNEFLYSSGTDYFADDWRNIVSFQFADLSAVAPFQYHSVRSLGFLLYAICHLQNRLRCKFAESVFEALMMYFRVKSQEDVARVLKVNLFNRGFIDDNLQFIPAADRFQVNSPVVELQLRENAGLINKHVSSYVQNQETFRNPEAKNKMQVMAELNAMTTMVSAALLQAYSYQFFQNEEIKRRFFKKHSDDPDVIEFQAACASKIPEKLMVAEAWTTEAERTIGQGNKTMEMAIVDMLMQYRNLFDPEPQRQILRDFTLALTDDPARADVLVPEEPVRVTDAVHDAQLAAGTLMQGLPVALKTGMDHVEYVEALLVSMAVVIQKGKNNGNMLSPPELLGLQNIAMHIQQHIDIIAENKAEEARARDFGKKLSNLMNEVKGFAQRLAEQMKSQQGQNGQGGPDPKAIAKAQEIKLMGDVKRQTMAESRAARQAERRVEFQMETQRDQQKAALEMQRDERKARLELGRSAREHGVEVSKKLIEAQANVAIAKAKAKAQAAKPKPKSK